MKLSLNELFSLLRSRAENLTLQRPTTVQALLKEADGIREVVDEIKSELTAHKLPKIA